MQLLEWSEDYSVGIPELDIQHRQLMELASELIRVVNLGESVKPDPAIIEKMAEYAERHLQREELVLRVRGYPDYLEHKAEHDAYRRKIVALRAQPDRRDLGVRIANFLNEWWKSHILISDQEYARYFRRQPPGQ
jgi:hemerythrin